MSNDKDVEITEFIELLWADCVTVGICHIAEVDERPYLGSVHPTNNLRSVTLANGTIVSEVMINVSTNACKSFGFNKDTDCFDYDISVGGTPFYGSIPINSINRIVDIDIGSSLKHFPISSATLTNLAHTKHIEQNVSEVVDYNGFPVLVSSNKNAAINKSKAKLVVVK